MNPLIPSLRATVSSRASFSQLVAKRNVVLLCSVVGDGYSGGVAGVCNADVYDAYAELLGKGEFFVSFRVFAVMRWG